MVRLGRYELLRVLGSGGTGVVHEAVLAGPDGLRKPVALKVLHGAGEGLRREARLGGLLRHRHLVDVYEVGEEEGRWFCAMELCRLGSLSARLPLPPRAVVEVGLAVCDALRYAHEELGLVHLDLKPDNLLLDEHGVVKVADLGIARAQGFGADGRIRGTPGYMAPEQARGDPVDGRTDLYALGVTLVELATGGRATASGTVALSTAELDADELPAPDGPPRWLLPAVERCLEPDPADRWADAAALAGALDRLDVGGPGLRETLRLPELGVAAGRDAFVGRAGELAELAGLLAAPGVVLVKGPAGIGKSRLVREAAERWRAAVGRPAFVCDASERGTVDGLLSAVATALDVPLGRGRTEEAVTQLGHAVAGRGEVLLVLDGVDRPAASAEVVQRWGVRAGAARLLVTSRGLPNLTARVVEVGPLPAAEAVALIVARARERGAEVAGDPGLSDLAARLDGLPLALELAAGRLGVLSVAEVLERLGLSFLRRATEGRHGTLRAALDWSWTALSDRDRSVLAALSVFSGGFTPEAAAAVVDLPGAHVSDALAALREASMVSLAGDGRLRLLSSVRAYAAEQLGDDLGPADRHARWFAALGTDETVARLDLVPGARARLAEALDNLVAACRHAVARGEGSLAARLLAAAWAAMEFRGPFEAAARLAESVVASGALAPSDRARSEALLAGALQLAGRGGAAREHLEAALAFYRESGDRRRAGFQLANLGSLHREQGRLDEAEAHFEAALAVHREEGDRRAEGVVLGALAVLQQRQGRVDEAEANFSAALAIHREVGNRRSEGVVLGNLGVLHLAQGRTDEGRRHLEDALVVHREVGNRRSEGIVLGNLGSLFQGPGRLEEARVHFEAALAVHREVGNRSSEGTVLSNLGIVLQTLERSDQALAHYEAALVVHREVGNRASEGVVLGYLGTVHRELGRPEEALAHLEAALVLFRGLGDDRSEPLVLASVARVAASTGDWSRAEAALAQAQACGRPPHPYARAMVHVARADLATRRGDVRAGAMLLADAEAEAPDRADVQREVARVRALLRSDR